VVLLIPRFAEKVSLHEPFPLNRSMKTDEELRQRLNPWDWLVLVVAVVSLLLVVLETFLHIPPGVLSVLRTVDTLSCLVFLADVFVRWRREKFAASYWRWAWIDVLASIPFEPAFRSLQAIRIYRFIRLVRVLRKLSTLTSGTSLNEKLLALPGVTLVMVLFSTMLMVEVERSAANATIKSGGDALWWALTTVTTVGYGDTYPVTTEGRIIASVMMLIGIALFGSMSAIVTSKLILPKETRDHEELRHEIRSLHAEIRELRRHLPDLPKDPHA
jgi:voltage-gated potassium channel